MSTYEKNMEFFRKNADGLYRIVQESSAITNITIEETEDEFNFKLLTDDINCFIHSIYNIEHEMEMMFKDVSKDVDTIILFGIGNGKAIKYILDKYKYIKTIAIVEPSLQIFKKCLEIYDMTKLSQKNCKINFIVNQTEEEVINSLMNEIFTSNNTAFVNHIYYCNIFFSYSKKITTDLSKQLKITHGSCITVSSQWDLWNLNSIRNLKQRDIVPIEEIKDRFKGKTAVIVSAGPSLNKNIDLINTIKDKAIIIAVGSAIKVLDSKGIIPHFRVVIDAFNGQMDVVEAIDTKSTDIMFSNQVYFEILPNYKGNKIRYVLDSDFLGKYIYKKGGIEYIEFKSGASVANGALDLICGIGCNRVIFMGQDLSYTKGERLHAKGVIAKAEEADIEWVNNQEQIPIENIYGDTVYTLNPLLQMKYMLERTVKKYPNIQFLNATEGGIGIEGVLNRELKDIMEKELVSEPKFNMEDISLVLTNNDIKKEYSDKIQVALNYMETELKELNEIQIEINHFLVKVEKLKNKNKLKNLNKIENDLMYVEKLMLKMSENSLYKEVIDNVLKVDLFSIEKAYAYRGNDREKIIDSNEKIIKESFYKISKYINMSISLLEEK